MREIKTELKSLFAVALREVKSRVTLFGAALVIGFLPLLTPVFSKFGLEIGSNDVGIITFAIMICTAFAFSSLLGEGILGREIANRQISFYFSRPISSLTLYLGKILGALSIITVAQFLTALPSLIFFSSQSHQFFAPYSLTIYTIVSLVCFSLATTGSIIFRSKSLWLIADLVLTPISLLLAAFAFLVVFVAYFNPQYGTYDIDKVLVFLPITFSLLLLVGLGVAFSIGRTNIKQIHKSLSIGFWSTVLVVLMSGFGFSQWIVSASPEDLTNVGYGKANSKGNWIYFNGVGWGRGSYPLSYLLNVNNGNYHSFGNFSKSPYEIKFSPNGNKAVWLESKTNLWGLLADKVSLVKADLTNDKINPVYTNILLSSFGDLTLSDDGSVIAFTRDKMITLFDLNTDKELTTVHIPVPNGFFKGGVFLNNELARFYIFDEDQRKGDIYTVRIFELNINDKKLVEVGQAMSFRFNQILLSNDKEKMILNDNEHTSLRNAKTGELISNLANISKDYYQRSRFIANDKIALVEVNRNTKENNLQIFSKDGQVEKTIKVGDFADVYIAESINDHLLLVKVVLDYNIASDQKLALLDINTGSITVTKEQNLKQLYDWQWGVQKSSTLAGTSERYFFNKQGLVKVDFTKDSKEVMNSFGFAK